MGFGTTLKMVSLRILKVVMNMKKFQPGMARFKSSVSAQVSE